MYIAESRSQGDGMFDETDSDDTETSNKTDIEAGIYLYVPSTIFQLNRDGSSWVHLFPLKFPLYNRIFT